MHREAICGATISLFELEADSQMNLDGLEDVPGENFVYFLSNKY